MVCEAIGATWWGSAPRESTLVNGNAQLCQLHDLLPFQLAAYVERDHS